VPRGKLGLFLAELRREPGPLGDGEPPGVARSVGQDEEAGEPEQNGRHALEDEQPLPAMQAEEPVDGQQPARNWRADHIGYRVTDQERRRRPGAPGTREPVGEEQEDARRKARLRHTEQQPRQRKAEGSADHGCERRAPR